MYSTECRCVLGPLGRRAAVAVRLLSLMPGVSSSRLEAAGWRACNYASPCSKGPCSVGGQTLPVKHDTTHKESAKNGPPTAQCRGTAICQAAVTLSAGTQTPPLLGTAHYALGLVYKV
ncbi:hypothetical protein SKAU_G00168750 [Synaphobranchus kaupii]|uniref:Uncharacterized protein n=1 Tax=Synaphobranchus kaupii TaxID=118154 RepID=A0A9Q1FKL0_SYNKA|nr:hypothetical protein SKAU_G00168750 [Synaphobranchus kaupii]